MRRISISLYRFQLKPIYCRLFKALVLEDIFLIIRITMSPRSSPIFTPIQHILFVIQLFVALMIWNCPSGVFFALVRLLAPSLPAKPSEIATQIVFFPLRHSCRTYSQRSGRWTLACCSTAVNEMVPLARTSSCVATKIRKVVKILAFEYNTPLGIDGP